MTPEVECKGKPAHVNNVGPCTRCGVEWGKETVYYVPEWDATHNWQVKGFWNGTSYTCPWCDAGKYEDVYQPTPVYRGTDGACSKIKTMT